MTVPGCCQLFPDDGRMEGLHLQKLMNSQLFYHRLFVILFRVLMFHACGCHKDLVLDGPKEHIAVAHNIEVKRCCPHVY
jgi:hypothetical protein